MDVSLVSVVEYQIDHSQRSNSRHTAGWSIFRHELDLITEFPFFWGGRLVRNHSPVQAGVCSHRMVEEFPKIVTSSK